MARSATSGCKSVFNNSGWSVDRRGSNSIDRRPDGSCIGQDASWGASDPACRTTVVSQFTKSEAQIYSSPATDEFEEA